MDEKTKEKAGKILVYLLPIMTGVFMIIHQWLLVGITIVVLFSLSIMGYVPYTKKKK
ncbi:MAG: hypothetical protein WC861_04175 [Candidatus Micrarchaeia archaeon]|jgi:hypothetical protein